MKSSKNRFMRAMLGAALIGCFLVAAFPCGAQQAETDPRLEKKVTVDVAFTKLEDVLKSLSDQTGVSIRAGGSDREWRVRERLVTIEAKDVPLGKLLDDMAALLRYRVARGKKDGQLTYLVWQDANSRDLEADLKTSEIAGSAERVQRARQSALDTADKAVAMQPETALAQKDSDPWMAYLGGTKAGRGYATLLQAVDRDYPNARDLMLRGRSATISLDGASAELMQAVNDMDAGGIMASAMRKNPQSDYLSKVLPKEVLITPMGSSGSGNAGAMGFGGMIWVLGSIPGQKDIPGFADMGANIPLGIMPIAAGGSAMGKIFGKMMFLLESGADIMEASQKIQSEMTPDMMADALGRTSPMEKQPPTEEWLTREVEVKDLPKMGTEQALDPTHKAEHDTWVVIAGVLGMPAVVETFPAMLPPAMFIKPGKQPVYKVLIALEKSGLVWQRKDGMLLVQPEDWAVRRSWAIPESFMQRYRDTLAKQGFLTLDDLADIASSLSDEQIQNTLVTDPQLMMAAATSLANPMGSAREVLRFYGSLSAGQKTRLAADSGLAFGALSPDQWDKLSEILTERLGGLYISDGSVRMTRSTEEMKKQMMGSDVVSFKITAAVANEATPRTVTETVMVPGKQQVDMMNEQIKKMGAEQKKKDEKPAK